MEQLNIEQFKAEVHRTLISRLDLEKLSRVNSGQARHAVAGMISEIISSQRVPLNLNEQDKMQEELLDEVFGGHGPQIVFGTSTTTFASPQTTSSSFA